MISSHADAGNIAKQKQPETAMIGRHLYACIRVVRKTNKNKAMNEWSQHSKWP